jgi:LPXTG-motif cell wall-anchored protein
MKVLSRLVPVVLIVLALFSASLPAALAAPAAQSSGPQTFTVLVGTEADIRQLAEGPAGAWQIMKYYPDTLTVNEGDTIVWKINSTEFHTVSFLAPGQQGPAFVVPEGGNSQRLLINSQVAFATAAANFDGTQYASSGLLQRNAPPNPTEFKLNFSKAGSYDYVCLVHQEMKGKVIVQPKGTAYPKTQAQIDADATAQIAADQQMAMGMKAQAAAAPPSRPGPNGTTVHVVNMGYSANMVDYMMFVPNNLTIKAGDTVEWQANNAATPHTATLLSGTKEPGLILPEPQPSGPPKLVFNPQVVAPAGGSTYSGKGYTSSGLINGQKDPAPGPKTYTLVFDKPGTYTFLCLLHDQMGMTGTITVLASTAGGATTGSTTANAPSTLPTTGDTPSTWPLAAAGAALTLAGAYLLKRSRAEQA